ncbi:MAG: TerC family protein [Chloroflexota bacterium]|nr:TerC family protein [Chloroflexota bacterium]
MIDAWSWLIFGAVLGTFLAIDLFFVQRRHGPMRVRTALVWVAIWVSLGLGFAVFVYLTRGTEAAGAYLAGYLIEYSLSADNVFVFAMLFAYFAVPAENQRLLLFWGVLGAIVFRAIFILGGIVLIHLFEPAIYVFGAILIVTGVRMAMTVEEGVDAEGNAVLRVLRRWLPMSSGYAGRAFFVRRDGRRLATPLLAALVAIELSDIMFAIDSVPAILAITTDPFIVLTSNGFAILGLRSLYFLLAGMLGRFVYLRLGLGAILVFAGAKMLLSDVFPISTFISLGVIALILVVSIGASMIATRRRPEDVGFHRRPAGDADLD